MFIMMPGEPIKEAYICGLRDFVSFNNNFSCKVYIFLLAEIRSIYQVHIVEGISRALDGQKNQIFAVRKWDRVH